MIEPLSHIGADEFYCGVKKQNQSTLLLNTNRRCMDDASFRCNFRSIGELKLALKIAHSLNKKIFLTLNENYTRLQFRYVLKELNEISRLELDGLIVTDLNLILELRKNHPDLPIHISMLSAVFNSETVKFYRDLGATRIILPRGIYLEEVQSIRNNNPQIEIEAFIDYFINCPNIEGTCHSIHGINPLLPTLCHKEYLYRINAKEEIPPEYLSTCRLCNLYDYQQIGIDSLKITGREYPTEASYVSLYLVKELMRLSKKISSKETFVKTVSSSIDSLIEQGFELARKNVPHQLDDRSLFQLMSLLKSGIICQRYGKRYCYFQKERV
ncbi:MAG: U32 family peptidase [Candidatus Aenigmarchaeota archaeon]|nr:U32 family peptidase [Candidatus Aenigmarchaeota archaeon]